ncbi:MAG: T9SS type A sorting domain-containing protein [Bacteroidetes bacterium]|nr:T9SS type A sorting domain-containing protein [Bacteroidota bacterium]
MKIKLLLAFVIATISVNAQVCKPDSSIPDTAFGVFPMPYHQTENPDGGISTPACINKEYAFVLTANVGDSFPFGTQNLPLDSLRLGKTGAVAGLPAGISYACDPPRCTFVKGTRGCVILQGVVKDAKLVGNHELKLKGTLYANGSPSGLNLTFPSPLIAPGNYTLRVLEENSTECGPQSISKAEMTQFSLFPNPTMGQVTLALNNYADAKEVRVYNSLGKLKDERKVTSERMSINMPEPGIYFIECRFESGLVSKKVVVAIN